MFELLHGGESIGRSRLESGDPAAGTVSGVFINLGGAKALARWIKSVGGQEEDGAVFISMDQDFALENSEGEAVRFTEGTLIAVPAEDETFVELTGISSQDYRTHFSGHLAAMSNEP